MTPTLRGFLIGIAVVVVGLILFVAGMVFGRFGWGMAGYSPASAMAGYGSNTYGQTDTGSAPYGYGMMGPGMTLAPCGGVGVGYNCSQVYTHTSPYGYGMMGPGMMGMMGGFGSNTLRGDVEPLSLDEAQEAVEDYLSTLGNDDLELAEVMIFDNHAYAEVIEKSTGIGAFEVLVDPVTRAVLPEPGPNMMWNVKYGHMSGLGMGMMGNFGGQRRGGMMGGRAVPQISTEMRVTPDEAVVTAQRYLDRYLPGTEGENEADAFYGYYTLHIQRDGQTVGMLSVNGHSRQVFPHTWHGEFLEMSEDMHSTAFHKF
jgi:hypothetical protein